MTDIRARLAEMTQAATLLSNIADEVVRAHTTVESITGADAMSAVWVGSSCDSYIQGAVAKVLTQFDEMTKNITASRTALDTVIASYAKAESENVRTQSVAADGFKQPTYDKL